MPGLIVNGDDFGLSQSVNRAIIEAYARGALTSASLMINEPAADEAIGLARDNPGLGVGLHLVLVLGCAALGPEEIPHLVDSRGRFPDSPFRAGLKYYFHPAARRELRREMRAQFEKFAASGLPFSHVDGHNHLHMHPVVFSELVELCSEFNVRSVRVIGEDDISTHKRILGRVTVRERVICAVFERLRRSAIQMLAGRGFAKPPRVYGLLQTGDMNEQYLRALLAEIESTDAEIYMHPLAPDAVDEERRLNPGGMEELAALLNPRVREVIAARGFRLATYQTLQDG